ncbi:MAG TPA: PAS domain S-box protein [Longimicrobiaceae bacterium]|nr:PAS domain S-box protein [Longimicrobiaceae bacterium]
MSQSIRMREVERPPSTALRVLLVEDDAGEALRVEELLGRSTTPVQLRCVRSYREARAAIREDGYDIALLADRLASGSGVELLHEARAAGVSRPFLLLTGGRGEPLPLDSALAAGAEDVLTRQELTPALLSRVIRYAVERARVEARLIESEELLRTLVENSPDVISRLDRDLRHVYVNPAIVRETGVPAEAFLGRTHAEFAALHGVPEPFAARWTEALTRARDEGRPETIEFEFPGAPGSRRWECRIGAVRSRSGEVEGLLAIGRDVTALRESEARYRAIVNQAGIGIAIVDLVGRPVQSNPALRRMLGYSATEFAEMPFEEFTHPDDVTEGLARFVELMEGRRDDYRMEKRFIRADGSVMWGDLTVTLLRTGGGAPLYAVALIEDVTERRQAERALRESEQRFRAIFEGSNDAVFLYALEEDGTPTRFYEVNQIACERLGYTREDLLRMTVADLNPHAGAPSRLPEIIEQMLRDGRFLTEHVHTTADGRRVPVEINASLIELAGRKTIVAIARDVSERKRTEEALRATNEILQALIEAMPLAVCASDSEGRVTTWNPAAERIFGWTAEEVLGRPCPIVFSHEAEPSRAEGVEAIATRKDGGTVQLSIWSAPVLRDASGEARSTLGVYADVTEQKQLEERLRLAERLESVGRLAGGVAHDFNNLLTVISGNTQMMLADLPTDSPLYDDLRDIRQAAERAAALTRQLLAFSRRQMLQPRVLDLNEEVTGTGKMLRRILGEDVKLVTELTATHAVEVDPGQLSQVLINLAVNARDAMPVGGVLTIETRDVELGERHANLSPYPMRAGVYVLLSVSDTGYGMDEETLANAFEPFFSTKGNDGTGLGLATVYGIVKQSGGYIWVESAPGEGTAFHIYLPQALAPAEAEPEKPEPAPRGAGQTILLVEDEEAVRSLVRRLLLRGGYTVLSAGDGEDALRVCADFDGHIDLVLTDVVMPRMSGRELAEKLAELRPASPILFMSGYTDDDLLHHGVREAGFEFLQKPIDSEELLARIAAMLESR